MRHSQCSYWISNKNIYVVIRILIINASRSPNCKNHVYHKKSEPQRLRVILCLNLGHFAANDGYIRTRQGDDRLSHISPKQKRRFVIELLKSLLAFLCCCQLPTYLWHFGICLQNGTILWGWLRLHTKPCERVEFCRNFVWFRCQIAHYPCVFCVGCCKEFNWLTNCKSNSSAKGVSRNFCAYRFQSNRTLPLYISFLNYNC